VLDELGSDDEDVDGEQLIPELGWRSAFARLFEEPESRAKFEKFVDTTEERQAKLIGAGTDDRSDRTAPINRLDKKVRAMLKRGVEAPLVLRLESAIREWLVATDIGEQDLRLPHSTEPLKRLMLHSLCAYYRLPHRHSGPDDCKHTVISRPKPGKVWEMPTSTLCQCVGIS
jgi:hypothetical protein